MKSVYIRAKRQWKSGRGPAVTEWRFRPIGWLCHECNEFLRDNGKSTLPMYHDPTEW